MASEAILITRPNHDLLNTYFFQWCKEVIQQAQKHKVKVLDLAGKKANKSSFTSYIEKNDPKLVFMNGHGNSDCIAGFDDEIILEVGSNEELLQGKIVYIRSCNVAERLGKTCIEKNTLAFIGYLKKYVLAYTPSSSTHPLQDKVASLFLIPSNLIPITLLKGNSVGEAYKKSQNVMKRNFRFMLSTKATKEQQEAAPSLWRNMKYQVVLGNDTAKL